MKQSIVVTLVMTLCVLASGYAEAQYSGSVRISCIGGDNLGSELSLRKVTCEPEGVCRFRGFLSTKGENEQLTYDIAVEVEHWPYAGRRVGICGISVYTTDADEETRAAIFGYTTNNCLSVRATDEIGLSMLPPKPDEAVLSVLPTCWFSKFRVESPTKRRRPVRRRDFR